MLNYDDSLVLCWVLSLTFEQLETNSEILLEKASLALKKYNMHAVIANELATRKEEVTVVTPDGKTCIRREVGDDIENPLVELLVEKHMTHVAGTPQNQ